MTDRVHDSAMLDLDVYRHIQEISRGEYRNSEIYLYLYKTVGNVQYSIATHLATINVVSEILKSFRELGVIIIYIISVSKQRGK